MDGEYTTRERLRIETLSDNLIEVGRPQEDYARPLSTGYGGDRSRLEEVDSQLVHTGHRPVRTTRNQRAVYEELSPKKTAKLHRLPHIKPNTCRLAIGPSQQYEGGSELYLDQAFCKRGTVIAYYEGEVVT